MDITKSTEPRSDQMNYDDVSMKDLTVTVADVKRGTADQPVEVHLVEFPGRPYKPAKSMRRVLLAAWGAEAAEWVGRQMTLYGDPTVKFGGVALGGIRIGRLSHITEPLTVSLTVTRGKRAPFVVQPLDAAAFDEEVVAEWVAALDDQVTLTDLQGIWQDAVKDGIARDVRVSAAKDTRKAALTTPDTDELEIPPVVS